MNKYTETLQNLVNQCTCTVLNIKITRFKIRINFKMRMKVSVIHSGTQQCHKTVRMAPSKQRTVDVTVLANHTGMGPVLCGWVLGPAHPYPVSNKGPF
jgi:hypothetical protein